MGCSQPAAWTTNRNLHVASRVKAFPRRLTNSGLTLPRAAHLDGGAIGCIHHTLSKCFDISRHAGQTPWHCPACLPTTTSIQAIAMANYTHTPSVPNSSAFHAQLLRLCGSSSSVCGDTTTAIIVLARPS